MALLKGKYADVPPDAIVLTEKEALNYELKVLLGWGNMSDIWALKYGGAILASLTALSGVYLNNHYRTKFKLRHYGRLSSYLPGCLIPTSFSLFLHGQLILPDVILQKNCPVCIELRSASFQAFSGSVFPALLACVSTISLATRFNTYNVPYLTQYPWEVLKLVKKISKPLYGPLTVMFIGHALTASLVTYLENKSVETVNEKLRLLEQKLEREHA